VILSDTGTASFWSLGDGPYYYNFREDHLLADSDWVLKNSGLVLLDLPITVDVSARVGAMDNLSVAVDSGRVTNKVGLGANFSIRRIGKVLRELSPLFFVGYYTHHASVDEFRQGEINFMAALNAGYELTAFGD
jgi:hypothetical protein